MEGTLNGDYFNIKDSLDVGLWRTLFSSHSIRHDTNHFSINSLINLQLNDSKTLIVKLIDGDKTICQIRLEGCIENDFFSVKRKIKFIPIPLLFWVYHERKLFLGIDKIGDLVLIEGRNDRGMVLFFAAENHYIIKKIYSKIKN